MKTLDYIRRSMCGLAMIAIASFASPAWSQSAWPSYPNNTAITVTNGGSIGIGAANPSLGVTSYPANARIFSILGPGTGGGDVGVLTVGTNHAVAAAGEIVGIID